MRLSDDVTRKERWQLVEMAALAFAVPIALVVVLALVVGTKPQPAPAPAVGRLCPLSFNIEDRRDLRTAAVKIQDRFPQ